MHKAVLKKEALDLLKVEENKNFIDCTAGQGGHLREMLKRNAPKGKVMAFEWDKEMYDRLNREKWERAILLNRSYTSLKKSVEEYNFFPVSGILMDLGMSTWHIKESGRGFSFREDEPLDMRYDQNLLLRAEDIVNKWRERDIEKIIKSYGEERYSKEIAREIIAGRPIRSSLELSRVVEKALPSGYKKGKIHPATLTFQALRVAVNLELENLKEALPQALEVLEKGGRLAVISFHSLEDEIVKKFLRDNFKVITKKPITPLREELRENPSSRSAKLRVGIKYEKEE